MGKNFMVSPSPHIRTKDTVEGIMRDVVIALIPAIIASIYFFRLHAVILLTVSVVSAVLSEAIVQKLRGQKINFLEGSAIITGILFAFVVSPVLPWWQVVIGSSTSIIFGKAVFGGLGNNIFNPALVGRAIVMASWPVAMTTWIKPLDGAAGATPLGILKMQGYDKLVETFGGTKQMYIDLFIGNVGGSLGETSAVALLIGAAYMFYRRVITWHTPVTYIATVMILAVVFHQDPMLHLLSGGLILGAFFMATDMVTTPITGFGKILFGIGAGILVVWIRMKGGYPEGVCYSILIMNGVTPLINRYTKPKMFGEVKNNG